MTRPAQSKTVLFQAPLVINPTNNRLLRILQQTDNNIQDQI
jgi:flagellar assembly factor FliW